MLQSKGLDLFYSGSDENDAATRALPRKFHVLTQKTVAWMNRLCACLFSGSQNAIKIGNPFAPGGTPNSTNLSITCPTSVRNKAHWYNPCAYANPLPASAITPFAKNNGNPTVPAPGYLYPTYVTNEAQALLFLGGRSNQIYGPGFQRLDASVFKHFTTFREQFLELRVDAFNLANTPSYGIPSTTTDGVNGGQITEERKGQNLTPDARFFQLSAKYVF